VISELQKFECIRYPDLIVAQGMESEITRGKPAISPPTVAEVHAQAR
jgi:hypothetical protein